MSKNRHGPIGHAMNGVTERHTRDILRAAGAKRNEKPPVKATVEHCRALLTERGILPDLETMDVQVVLPGGREAVATGVDVYGRVIVEGWDVPFNPKAIKRAESG